MLLKHSDFNFVLMKEMWNSRYAEPEYVYGKEPNRFFESNIGVFKPNSKILFASEGEGRNAVFALKQGLQAIAVDFSEEAKKKAISLANDNQVNLEYYVSNLLEVEFSENSFDGVVLIFAHFPPQIRQQIHRKLQSFLKPGGILVLEAFSKNHLEVSKNNERTSGPQNLEMLFTVEMLKEDFNELNFSLAIEEIEILNESLYHEGKSSLIRMIGTKK